MVPHVEAMVERWLAHNPTAKSPQSKKSATNWLTVNINPNTDPLSAALRAVYGDAAQIGVQDANNTLTGNVGFDWDKWTPGNEQAARLLDGDGLRGLLDSANVTIAGIGDTTLSRVADALATGVDNGLGIKETARLVNDAIDDPVRALTIAMTETNRALSVASMGMYEQAGVEQVEWLVLENIACEVCLENADASPISRGDVFPSGDTEPPGHPNCFCAISPVVSEEMSQEAFDTAFEEWNGEGDGEGQAGGGKPSGSPMEAAAPAEDTVHDGRIIEPEFTEPELNAPRYTADQMNDRLLDIYKDVLARYDGDYDAVDGLRSSDPGDKMLSALWQEQGFDAKPALVTQDQMQTLIDKGWQPMFRGISGETPEIVAQHVDSYKTGDPFPGKGMFGNGTYTGGLETAENFSQRTPDGTEVPHGDILRMALNPEANTISFEDLAREYRDFKNEAYQTRQDIEARYPQKDNQPYGKWLKSLPDDVAAKYKAADNPYLLEDFGRFATVRGYDAYYIENPQVNFSGERIQDTYYVILNRGAVAIVK